MLHVKNWDVALTAAPPRRTMEFQSAAKRRYFSAEEKARIVAESFEDGASVCSVARRHGLMAAQLFAWRKNARLGGGDSLAAKNNADPALDMEMAPTQTVEAGAPQRAAPIEIAIGDAIVRVPPGSDAATLRMVLEMLAANA